MIVWLNGPFGAAKTTTARKLARAVHQSRILDSEQVGYMLRRVLTERVEDFQDWPPWRPLVIHTAVAVLHYVGGALVIPQAVLVERYARETFQGLSDAGVVVRHFLLHVERDELVSRIEGGRFEATAREWRLDHIPRYEAALPWLHESADFIDTTGLPPQKVGQVIADRLGQS